MLNICRVWVFTSSGSVGGRGGRGGDAKTIISPNTSFGDIIIPYEPVCIHLSISYTHINDIIEISMKIAVRNAKLYPRFHTTWNQTIWSKKRQTMTCNIVVIRLTLEIPISHVVIFTRIRGTGTLYYKLFDVLFNVMANFLMSWRNFGIMTYFWHYGVLIDAMTYFLT